MERVYPRNLATADVPSSAELLDLLPFGLLLHDGQGRVVWANRPFADLLGYSVVELLDLGAAAFVHPEDLEQRTREVGLLLSGVADELTSERRLIHRNGTVIRVRAKKNRLRLGRGGTDALVMVCVEDWAAEHEQLVDLAWAASHDGLTGLVNRAGLIAHLELLQRGERPTAVALIDLNGFKSINDRYGHSSGDEYLRGVARRLSSAVADVSDSCVARLAGDEFVVICSGDSEDAVDPRALEQKIRDALAEPITIRDSATGAAVSPVVSAAVGSVARAQGMNPEQVLDQADRLMYAQKGSTRAAVDDDLFPRPRDRYWREHLRRESGDLAGNSPGREL